MSLNFDQFIKAAPDPEVAATRFEHLCSDHNVEQRVGRLDESLQKELISIISLSNFLFRYLVRHPESISLIGHPASNHELVISGINDLNLLRLYKYQELLKITWMDISGVCNYQEVLTALSELAVNVIRQALRITLDDETYRNVVRSLSIVALGKLGANELNYSSDIDLIFVSVNPDKSITEYQTLQKTLIHAIRTLSQNLQENTAEGFLYRVDLKLRPWGNSGPLCMAIDDTEHYYEASSEPWERFAWLRARIIDGSAYLGDDLLQRMQPFVFRRSLSTDDLNRFAQIKNDMGKARKRHGHWDVKVGEGGIRDIEFFIQILQIVNAAKYPRLQTTNTIKALLALTGAGLITDREEKEIFESYIFLRRLENRLQMVDELRTHNLPDDRKKRLVIARSLLADKIDTDDVEVLFENKLITYQQIAKKYYDRVLPGEI